MTSTWQKIRAGDFRGNNAINLQGHVFAIGGDARPDVKQNPDGNVLEVEADLITGGVTRDTGCYGNFLADANRCLTIIECENARTRQNLGCLLTGRSVW